MQLNPQRSGEAVHNRRDGLGDMNWSSRGHDHAQGSLRGNSHNCSITVSGRLGIATEQGFLKELLASAQEKASRDFDNLQKSPPGVIVQTPPSSSMPGSPRTPAASSSFVLTNPYNTPLNCAPKGGLSEVLLSAQNHPLPIALPVSVFAEMTDPALGALQKTITSYNDILSNHTLQRSELLGELSKHLHVVSAHEAQYEYQKVSANDEAVFILELAFGNEDTKKRDERLIEATGLMKQAVHCSVKSMEFHQEMEKIRTEMEAVRMEGYNAIVEVFQTFIKDLKQAVDNCKDGPGENEKAKMNEVKIGSESLEVCDMVAEGMEDRAETTAKKETGMNNTLSHENTQITKTKDPSLEEGIKTVHPSNKSKKTKNNGNKLTQEDTKGEENKANGYEDGKTKNKPSKRDRKNRGKKNGSKSGSTSGVSDALGGSAMVRPAEG